MARKHGRTPHDVKVSVNLSPVQLGTIDLMRGHGWHSTRADIIRSAINRYFTAHRERIDRQIERGGFFVGSRVLSYEDMESLRNQGRRADIRCLGYVHIDHEAEADLVEAAVGRITVLGVLDARPDVIRRIAERVERSP